MPQLSRELIIRQAESALRSSPCACGAQKRAIEVDVTGEPRVVTEQQFHGPVIGVILPTTCRRCGHRQNFSCAMHGVEIKESGDGDQ